MVKKEFSSIPFKNLELISETRDHFIARCPYCGDSQHHKNKGHFYLAKKLPVFYCHRCSASGSIKQLEELLDEKCLYEYSSDVKIKNGNYKNNTHKKVIFKDSNLNEREKEYLDSRCNELKITEVEDYMKLFRIVSRDIMLKKFSNTPYANKILNRLWFLSALENTYIGRTINDDPIRWFKISSNPDLQNDLETDSYVVDNYSEGRIKNPDTLVIAEGIFDIIPIYINRKKYGIKDNAIFMGCMGLFYSRSIKTFQNLFSCKPKNIMVFVDKGVGMDLLQKQFMPYQKQTNNILIFLPPVKDWEESPLPKMKVKLFERRS